jgi:hypothetical protein
MPQYSWNTANVGVKHQSINQIIFNGGLVMTEDAKKTVKVIKQWKIKIKILHQNKRWTDKKNETHTPT